MPEAMRRMPCPGRWRRTPRARHRWSLVAAGYVVAVVLSALLLAGCGAAVPSDRPSDRPSPGNGSSLGTEPAMTLPVGDGMSVSLGIYSGRPDPSWTLSQAQAAELRRLIDALPSGVGDSAGGGLGYHGFTIALSGPDGDLRHIVAYHGEIAEAGNGARPTWYDAAGRVERFVLETGRPYLDPEEARVVDDDLEAFFGPPAYPAPSA